MKIITKIKLLSLFVMLTIASFSTHAQSARPVIAVGSITSTVQDFNTMSIQLALEDAFTKTNKYTIMERTRLEELFRERGLSIAGITDGAANLSGFSGVDYLVVGSVSNITVERANLLILFNCDATLSMNIRLVDMNNGEIRFSETVTTKSTVATVAEGDPCAGISLSSINILGEDATAGIANKMTQSIFPISVARTTDAGEIYLNYGAGTVSQNNLLTVRSVGEGFYDPVTNELLGVEEVTNAVIQITDVRPNFSIGRIIVSANPINIGDIAYFISESRSNSRAISSCTSSQRKMASECARDAGGRNCRRETESVASDCGALLNL